VQDSMKILGRIEIKWSSVEATYSAQIGLGLPTTENSTILEELRSTKQLFGNILGVFWGYIEEWGKGYQWRRLNIKDDDPETLKHRSIEMLEDAFKTLKDIVRENREKSALNKSITLETEIN